MRNIDVVEGDEFGKVESGLKDLLREFSALVLKAKSAASDMITTSNAVAGSADQINASVQQISSTVQLIAKGSQQQAEEIEDVNRLVENLSANTKNLASKAMRAAELSNTVGLSSSEGSSYASAAADKINRIIDVSQDSASNIRVLAERCSKVSSVLEVIRKISAKTNLLALNAAIESARAGEAGKGFGVVAEEIKDLAEGSARSSEEIEQIIEKIQQDARITVSSIELGLREIMEGKLVINKALQSLSDIAKKMQMVDGTVKGIATSINEQVSSVDQLGKRAADIAAFAEENAAATEECAAASEEESAGMQEITNSIHDLSNLGSQLGAMLSKYKFALDNRNGTSPSRPANELTGASETE
jgi:methyl-accepting chemotaxis protein